MQLKISENIAKYLIIGPLVLFIILPIFIMNNDFIIGFYHSKKTIIIYVNFFFSLYFLVFFIFHTFYYKKSSSLKLNLIDISLLLYFCYIFLNILLSNESIITNERFIISLISFNIYLTLRIFQKQFNFNLFNDFSLFIATVTALLFFWGGLQLTNIAPSANSYFSIVGPFINPDHFAAFLCPTIIISIYVSIHYYPSIPAKLYGIPRIVWLIVCSLFFFLFLFMLQSRSLIISISICSFPLLIYKYKNLTKKYFKTGNIYIIGLTIFTALIIFSSSELSKINSVKGRLLIWKISYSIFEDSPFFGIGYNNFQYEYNRQQEEYFRLNAAEKNNSDDIILTDNVKHAHSKPIEIITELGITGLILASFLIFSLLYSFNKSLESKNRLKQLALICAIFSVIIFSLFSFPLHIPPVQILFFILLGFYSNTIPGNNLKITKWGSLVFLIFAFFLSINFSVNRYTFNKHIEIWEEAFISYINKNYFVAENLYSTVAAELSGNGVFLLNYGGFLNSISEFEKSNTILLNADQYLSDPNLYLLVADNYKELNDPVLAEYYLLKAKFMIPIRLTPRYLLAKQYFQNNQYDKFNIMLSEINSMPIKIRTPEVKKMLSDLEHLQNNILLQKHELKK